MKFLIYFKNKKKYFSTFVSKHFTIPINDLKNVLEGLESRYRHTSNGYEVQICNFCDKGNKNKESNMWKLKVNLDGSYHCYRCSLHGTWFDLKKKVGNSSFTPSSSLSSSSSSSFSSSFSSSSSSSSSSTSSLLSNNLKDDTNEEVEVKKYKIPDQELMLSHSRQILVKTDPDAITAMKYLTETRKISKNIILKYGVGISKQKFLNNESEWVELLCLSFPWMEVKKTSTEGILKLPSKKASNQLIEQTLFNVAASLNSTSSSTETNTNTNEISSPSVTEDFKTEKLQKTEDEDDVEIDSKTENTSSPQVPEIIRMKYRAIENKGNQRIFPSGGKWGFFGWHLVKPSHTEIIITEGEFDTMAVAQAISKLKRGHPLYKIPVVSLPNGASSLPPDLLPQLEGFTKIYLWMDNDESGHIASDKFARKLGIRRCVIVRPPDHIENPPKDANDALRHETLNGEELIINMLTSAQRISHNNLSRFNDFRNEVLNQIINGSKKGYSGSATPSIPALTNITKGFREGELVIFTGPTGTGKTTFLSQISLDFVKQGAPTLWGSFEIKNIQLLKSMLQQYHKEEKLTTLDSVKLELIANDFETLPMIFMNFHGGSELNDILDAMEFAVYQHDIKHIILDNLQFMMPRRQGRQYDKFEAQDIVIESFRKFATEKMVNIILVIHPRKEDDRVALNISSVFGTAKATQEADLVLILQRIEGGSFIDIRKNRFDGQLGRIPVDFNNMTKCFYESDRVIEDSQSNSNNSGNNFRKQNK